MRDDGAAWGTGVTTNPGSLIMLRFTATAIVLLMSCGPAAAQSGYGRHDNGASVECSSRDFRREHCNVDWRDARVERQLSDTDCERGENWDIDGRGLWVGGGCSAVFVEAGGRGRGGRDQRHGDRDNDHDDWRPGNDWDNSIRVRCESDSFDYYMCRVDTGRGSNVYVDSQISRTQCVEGQNWGWNRAGIWVNAGCAAVFVVERRWR